MLRVVPYNVTIYVAVDLESLDKEVSGAIGAAWSESTLKTRNSQWKKFIEFCHDNDLQPMPASHNTVARFMVFLARTCKYSTVNNYMSAVTRLHEFYGHDMDFRGSFLLKLVMAGIKRQLGDAVSQKMPLTPSQMRDIYAHLDMTDWNVATMWAALIFSFRTLLRKSNIVPDSLSSQNHVVTRGDIVRQADRITVRVSSTKTLKYRERVLEIPLFKVSSAPFCVVSQLERHLDLTREVKDGPLFLLKAGDRLTPLLYRDLLKFIKTCVSLIGLSPEDVGLHSMRRSGAGFLHGISIPLEDIKCLGDWKSMAVLMYLVTPFERKLSIEEKITQALSASSLQ